MLGFAAVLAQSVSRTLLEDSVTGSDWIRAGIVLFAALVVAVVVSKALRRVVARGVGQSFAAVVVSRLLGYTVLVVGLSYALTTSAAIGPARHGTRPLAHRVPPVDARGRRKFPETLACRRGLRVGSVVLDCDPRPGSRL